MVLHRSVNKYILLKTEVENSVVYLLLHLSNNCAVIKFQIPKTQAECKVVVDGSYNQWNCLGAVDGKHVKIKKKMCIRDSITTVP